MTLTAEMVLWIIIDIILIWFDIWLIMYYSDEMVFYD